MTESSYARISTKKKKRQSPRRCSSRAGWSSSGGSTVNLPAVAFGFFAAAGYGALAAFVGYAYGDVNGRAAQLAQDRAEVEAWMQRQGEPFQKPQRFDDAAFLRYDGARPLLRDRQSQ